jgi:hypothetical protein
VDGWLSLSGGRLGGNPGRSSTFAPTGGGAPGAGAPGAAAPGGARPGAPGGNNPMASAMTALRELPTADFSHIYETGQREVDEKGVPETSEWAKKYSCGPRLAPREVEDVKAGYVYDSARLTGLGTPANARQGAGLRVSRLQGRPCGRRRRAPR